MSYVLYHIASTEKIKSFKTESAAKRSTTCSNRNAKAISYAYASVEDYNANVVKVKKVINLISGKEIEIPSNTPRCCDPSSELYWSM